MPIDPMIARGYQGQIGNALMEGREMAEQSRTRQAQLGMDQQRNALLMEAQKRQMQQQDMQAQKEAEEDALWEQAVQSKDVGLMARIDPESTRLLVSHWQAQEPKAPEYKVVGDSLLQMPTAAGQDPRVAYQAPQRPTQGPTGSWSAPFPAAGPDGKPGLFRQHSITGEVQAVNVGGGNLAPPPKADATGANPLGNERQQAGVSMQRENAISYAANLTGMSRDEMERIYATSGADGVAKAMLTKGKRPLQGAAARVLQSFPLGKTVVEAKNSDLIAPAKGGGAGIALYQNPTGPITISDFQAGEAQFPNATYPLKSQAEMVRQMLKTSEKGKDTQAASPDNDPLGLR